jgi:hypothetical protein
MFSSMGLSMYTSSLGGTYMYETFWKIPVWLNVRKKVAISSICTPYTVRKMGLILRSIERMLKMQFSMARKFTLQPLHRYGVKPPDKTAQA